MSLSRDVMIVGAVALGAWVLIRRIPAGTFNPLSANNAAHRGVSAVVESITGIKGDTIGAAVHRWTVPDYEAYDPTKDTRGSIKTNSAPFVGDLPTIFDKPNPFNLPAVVPQPGLWDPSNPFAWGA